MKTPLPPWFWMLAAGLALGALPGCASTPADQEPDAKAAQTSPASDEKSLAADLRKGMTPEQVRQLLGGPAEVRPVDAPEQKLKAERWRYRRPVQQVVEQTTTGTRDIPYVDPITGETRMIPEPVYSQVTITITEELNLLWIEGQLADWTTQFRRDRAYQN